MRNKTNRNGKPKAALMLALFFLANCLIVFPVATAMLRGTPQMVPVFGPDSVARRLLASVYLGIGGVSLGALALMALGWSEAATSIAFGLFPMQIAYKALTLIAVGLDSPVVRVNLAVILLHSVTLTVLLV